MGMEITGKVLVERTSSKEPPCDGALKLADGSWEVELGPLRTLVQLAPGYQFVVTPPGAVGGVRMPASSTRWTVEIYDDYRE